MPFVGEVALGPIKEAGLFDRGRWRTLQPLIYKSLRHHDVVVSIPVGFETDLASVPRWLPITWMLTGGTNIKGSAVHDYIYHHPVYVGGEKKMLPRDNSHDIFDEIGEEDDVPGWRKNLMWAGVRAGGWISYDTSPLVPGL